IPLDGRGVRNPDDERVMAMAAVSRAPVLTFSTRGGADVSLVGTPDETTGGLAFPLDIGGARRSVSLSFAGRHNVVNALAAATAGWAVGLSPAQIVRGLEAARPPKGRCVWRRAGALRILDDTYNANPASVLAALSTLQTARAAQRLVVVLGDMLELGAIGESAHRTIGRAVAAAGAAEFIATGPLMRLAVEAAREACLAESHHAPTFEDTVALLLKRLVPGDAVLVKGSRGMGMERVVDALVARLGGGE
ncbi:MAG: cyanophycin synthetase, partial [candidate division NC10 bacterium]